MNKTLEYHLDFEFVENVRMDYVDRILPLSIGVKCEDGRSYYAVYDYAKNFWVQDTASEWIQQNVYPKLYLNLSSDESYTQEEIKDQLLDFFNVPDTKAQIITYWGAYDWVLFCQLFGGMMSLPDFIMPQPIDIYQSAFEAGIEIPERLKTWENEHHALADACAQEKIWTYVKNVKKGLR